MSSEDESMLKMINWPGIAAGILMILLPFTGAWWKVAAGSELFSVSLSPFHYEFMVMGEAMEVPVLNYLIIALQVLVVFGGIMLVLGSLFVNREESEKLIGYGSGKIIWPTVMFFIILLFGAFFVNNYLTGFMPVEEMEEVDNGAEFDFKVPYLVGTTTSGMQIGNMEASIPVTKSFQSPVLLGILAMSLALVSRRFHGLFS